jgi:hypothetical protein
MVPHHRQITGLYKKAWAHSDATIEALPVDAIGCVPHCPDEHRAKGPILKAPTLDELGTLIQGADQR